MNAYSTQFYQEHGTTFQLTILLFLEISLNEMVKTFSTITNKLNPFRQTFMKAVTFSISAGFHDVSKNRHVLQLGYT